MSLPALLLSLLTSVSAVTTPPQSQSLDCREKVPPGFLFQNSHNGLKTYRSVSSNTVLGITCMNPTQSMPSLVKELKPLGKVVILDKKRFYYEIERTRVATRIYFEFRKDRILNISFLSKRKQLPSEKITRKWVKIISRI